MKDPGLLPAADPRVEAGVAVERPGLNTATAVEYAPAAGNACVIVGVVCSMV